jgi:type IV fimbrial biogenesis protein FimT
VIFLTDIALCSAAAGPREATDSAGKAARRTALAKALRRLHNAPPMFPISPSTARAGFTLIELMVTISIMAILVGVTAPYLRDFLLDVRLTGQANDLLSDFMAARSESVKRDVRMTVCARRAAAAKSETCANGQQWDNGWLVVVDADGDGDMDAGTTPLRVADPLSGSNTIKNTGKGPKGTIIFAPTGMNTSGLSVFTICDSRGKGRALTIENTGRASVAKIESGCK